MLHYLWFIFVANKSWRKTLFTALCVEGMATQTKDTARYSGHHYSSKCDKVCGWCSESWRTVQYRCTYGPLNMMHLKQCLQVVGVIGQHDGVALTDNSGGVLMAAVAPTWTVPISYTSYRPTLLWYLPASTMRKTSSYMLLIQTHPSAPTVKHFFGSHSHLITCPQSPDGGFDCLHLEQWSK